jgi:hypothetical protein
MLKEEIVLLKSAKHRHYLLIGLLFFMLVPVPIISGLIYLCVTIDNPWILAFSIVYYGLLLFGSFCLVLDWVVTADQAMCEPLRELLEMTEAQEANRSELRQEGETIRRLNELSRRRQEQMRQQQREMAGRGRDAEGFKFSKF